MPAYVRWLAALLALVVMPVASQRQARGQHLLIPHVGCRCTANRGSLPHYGYGHDLQRFRDSAFAVADPGVTTRWLEENLVGERIVCGGREKVRQVPRPLIPEGRKPQLERFARRKPFHFTTGSLSANNVTLEQVGLSIYDTGNIAASGRISHDGGPNGSVAGANVTLRLRAYAAPVAGTADGRLPLNSPLVWESSCTLWVSRNQPRVVSLTPPGQNYWPILRRQFDEITHLEVELEAQQDR